MKKQMLWVEITSTKLASYWYAKRIGELFPVYYFGDLDSFPKPHYYVLDIAAPKMDATYVVNMEDCQILKCKWKN